MITRILVPLDSSEFSRTATRTACQLSAKNGAVVVGITILDMLGLTGQIAPIHAVALKAYHAILKEAEIDAHERIRYALAHFRKVCEDDRIAHNEHELQGISSNVIAQAAAYCDLVVMGLRTFYRQPQHESSTLADVIDRSATPILALPKHSPNLPKTVLVAYDGSHHSTRALHSTATLHQVAAFQKAYIVTSHPNPRKRSFLLQHAAAYLRSHHLDDVTLVDTETDIVSVIHEDYLDKVDLIALGVHSKLPFKDFFVGSLTKSLIDYGHKPLLLSQ